jgi:hypothetical protein
MGASYVDCEPEIAAGTVSKTLLNTLAAAHHDSWSHFITGDESWFYCSTGYETIRLPGGEERSIREKKVMKAENKTLTSFWSPRRLHLVDSLPKGG